MLRGRAFVWLASSALLVVAHTLFELVLPWLDGVVPYGLLEPFPILAGCFDVAACLALGAASMRPGPRQVARVSALLRVIALGLPFVWRIWPRLDDARSTIEAAGPVLILLHRTGLAWVVVDAWRPGDRLAWIAAPTLGLTPFLIARLADVVPGALSSVVSLVATLGRTAVVVLLAIAARPSALPEVGPLDPLDRALRSYVTASRARMLAIVAVGLASQSSRRSR